MRIIGTITIGAASVFVLLQFIRPSIPVPQGGIEIQAPSPVRAVLAKDCYSCHSDQRRLAWFDEVVPGYWLVRHDILTARTHLNFSTLGSKPVAAQRAALYEAVNMIQLGAMPPRSFTALHPEAIVTPEDLAALKSYLAPWSAAPPVHQVVSDAAEASLRPLDLTAVKPEFNGFRLDDTFESWKPISFTDRGDNNTFRFILGNETAVKAAQAGNISPWPDGADFAKIAWQQESGSDGLIHPGKFVQVEFMAKNASLYKKTAGWGWGRWRGMNLKPYGNDAHFVTECTSCHRPLRRNDDVYTLPITLANVNGDEVVNHMAASLPLYLPYQPLAWNAITMYVDPRTHTMATLYGNQEAAHAAQSHRANSGVAPTYSAGSVLALVTWRQRDDPHWFGGRIPDAPISIEFVRTGPQGAIDSYRRFDGVELREGTVSPALSRQRSGLIVGLMPVELP
jgi:hypothetical protein